MGHAISGSRQYRINPVGTEGAQNSHLAQVINT